MRLEFLPLAAAIRRESPGTPLSTWTARSSHPNRHIATSPQPAHLGAPHGAGWQAGFLMGVGCQEQVCDAASQLYRMVSRLGVFARAATEIIAVQADRPCPTWACAGF